ncbi:phosphorylase family protein [Nitrosovibrio sp. Nv4]|uniref:phosphorylase family protein n=1 Tax=Nitrosovibrio sp. Nv4 TaxID=1945880 RepID=UPI000BE266B7|nr:phosphorylase [Nitrosovibrio sp. Nv4]
MRAVGIVTALRVEARCITAHRLPFNQRISLGENAAIWLCGMGEAAAREAAEGLRTGGATALISFGFAGALDANLHPGHLILPESIHAGHSLQIDLGWRDRFRQRLPDHLRVSGGILAASRAVLTSATAKRELAQATGACAVDMESGAVAEAAAHAGLPFLAVRAISDPVEFSPPPVLLHAVRPDGSADLRRLLPLLMRRSLTLGTLLRLAKDSRAACSTLSTVARYADTEMGVSRRLPPSAHGYVSD